jgi:hypothetical protein
LNAPFWKRSALCLIGKAAVQGDVGHLFVVVSELIGQERRGEVVVGVAQNALGGDTLMAALVIELEMDASQQADFLSFVHDDGKGFIGIHSATITFTQWPAYGEMNPLCPTHPREQG